MPVLFSAIEKSLQSVTSSLDTLGESPFHLLATNPAKTDAHDGRITAETSGIFMNIAVQLNQKDHQNSSKPPDINQTPQSTVYKHLTVFNNLLFSKACLLVELFGSFKQYWGSKRPRCFEFCYVEDLQEGGRHQSNQYDFGRFSQMIGQLFIQYLAFLRECTSRGYSISGFLKHKSTKPKADRDEFDEVAVNQLDKRRMRRPEPLSTREGRSSNHSSRNRSRHLSPVPEDSESAQESTSPQKSDVLTVSQRSRSFRCCARKRTQVAPFRHHKEPKSPHNPRRVANKPPQPPEARPRTPSQDCFTRWDLLPQDVAGVQLQSLPDLLGEFRSLLKEVDGAVDISVLSTVEGLQELLLYPPVLKDLYLDVKLDQQALEYIWSLGVVNQTFQVAKELAQMDDGFLFYSMFPNSINGIGVWCLMLEKNDSIIRKQLKESSFDPRTEYALKVSLEWVLSLGTKNSAIWNLNWATSPISSLSRELGYFCEPREMLTLGDLGALLLPPKVGEYELGTEVLNQPERLNSVSNFNYYKS